MASHSEAKAAMDNLSRAEIKSVTALTSVAIVCLTFDFYRNHVIDVSWAVVQRSQGFLDGGDRSIPSPNDGPTPLPAGVGIGERSSSPLGGYIHPKRDFAPRGYGSVPGPGYQSHDDYNDGSSYGSRYPSRPSSYHEYTRPASADVRTTLIVSNIPVSIFVSESDLRPLFWPFGEVRRLEVIRAELPSAAAASVDAPIKPIAKPSSPVAEDGSVHERQETKKPESLVLSDKLSVIVEYASAYSAAEARAALHGQVYGTCAISVEYHCMTGSGSLSNSPTRSLPSLASSVSSAPSSAASSIPDISSLSIRAPPFTVKRHSFAEMDDYGRMPLSAGPWQTAHKPQLELTPSSPPHSARSLGGWPATDRYALPPPREYEQPAYGRDAFAPVRRGAMYDRSNNTSPFNSAVFPPVRRPYSPGPGSYGRTSYEDAMRREHENENRFGAIARPLSAVARLPPGGLCDSVHMPPAPVSHGNSPPRGIPRSKYDALMNDDYPAVGSAGRPARAFSSMPDVFDFPPPGLAGPRA
jgi:hypothetical protein